MSMTTKTAYVERLQYEADRLWSHYGSGLPLLAELGGNAGSRVLLQDLYPEIGHARMLGTRVAQRLNRGFDAEPCDAQTQAFLDAVAEIETRISYPHVGINGIYEVLPGLKLGVALALSDDEKVRQQSHLLLRVLLGLQKVNADLTRNEVDPLSFAIVTNPVTRLVLGLTADYLYAPTAD